MSLKATYELMLNIESFRNIDLYQQGLYYMRFYLTNEHEGKIDYAQPYNYLEGKRPQQKIGQQQAKNRDNHSWAPPQILDELSAFQSKTFMIRFQEESVSINETCCFKIEVPAYPQYDHYVFTLYCELLCADIQRIGGPPSDDSSQLFKCVSMFQSTITNSHNSVHEFVPILFDQHHFCVINCTLHTMLLNFKFCLSDMQVNLANNKENGVKGLAQTKNQNQSQKNIIISISPKTFTEYLNKITKFNKQDCEWFFNYFVGQLRQQCLNLQKFLQDIQKTLKIDISKGPQIPPYSYLVYSENNISLTDTQYQKKKNRDLYITEVFDVRSCKDQNMMGALIEDDFNQFARILFELNNILVQLLLEYPQQLRKYLENDYRLKIKDKWGETYLRQQLRTDDLSVQCCQKGATNIKVAKELRRKEIDCSEPLLDILDLDLIPKISLRPILFEEVFIKNSSSFYSSKQQQATMMVEVINVIVLVHGFQGNSFDMRLIKNNLSLMYPETLFLCSRANEEQTDGNISDMGQNLANEVRQFIVEWCNKAKFKQNLIPLIIQLSLTFIGHSLGGIIIRAALPLLQEYQNNMYSYVSFSSPHLGYLYNTSKLVDAGLWVLKRMRKSLSLQQLSMSDSEGIESSFLYKLSKQCGFNWFQNILFVSSDQDQYVPYESARVQRCEEVKNDEQQQNLFKITSSKGKQYSKMVNSLLGSLRTNKVHRINVNFFLDETQIQVNKFNKRTIDNMIGRTAHIQFIENQAFLKTLVNCLDGIFHQ